MNVTPIEREIFSRNQALSAINLWYTSFWLLASNRMLVLLIHLKTFWVETFLI